MFKLSNLNRDVMPNLDHEAAGRRRLPPAPPAMGLGPPLRVSNVRLGQAAALASAGLSAFEQLCAIDSTLEQPSSSEASYQNADGSWRLADLHEDLHINQVRASAFQQLLVVLESLEARDRLNAASLPVMLSSLQGAARAAEAAYGVRPPAFQPSVTGQMVHDTFELAQRHIGELEPVVAAVQAARNGLTQALRNMRPTMEGYDPEMSAENLANAIAIAEAVGLSRENRSDLQMQSACLELEGAVLERDRRRASARAEEESSRIEARLSALGITSPTLLEPAHFSCPITQELLEEAVVATDGKSYSREALEEWIRSSEAGGRQAKCPLNPSCRVRIADLRPNHELRSVISEHKQWVLTLAERAFAAGQKAAEKAPPRRALAPLDANH